MSMLYKAVRSTLRWALGMYYVDIQAIGLEHVPRSGALIFAANHPNSIMDTVLLGTQTHRTIRYMARSGLFKNPLSRALFNHFGVIPIYRPQDNPQQTGRNQDSFGRAYEVLQEGECIGIFPEGRNSNERAVFDIKTGTARIALGAEASADYDIGLKIIPVGLNFENRDRFLTSVLIRFGEPIEVGQWAQTHREHERAAVKSLTDHLQERLRQEATHIDDEVVRKLTRDIWAIYGQQLLIKMIGQWKKGAPQGDLPGERYDLDSKFWMKQRIADAINHFMDTDPEVFDSIRKRVRAYKDHLHQVELHHSFLERNPEELSLRRESIKFTLYAIVLAPIALWGLMGNVGPYTLTRAASLTAPDEPIRAIRGFSAGLIFYPLFYTLYAAAIWLLSAKDLFWTLGILASLPPAGFFYLRYRRQLARYRDQIIVRTLFLTDAFLLKRLHKERAELMDAMETLRQRFVDEVGSDFEAHLERKAYT